MNYWDWFQNFKDIAKIEPSPETAWFAAKADCREEMKSVEVRAQRSFDAWMEEKEKNAKFRKALDSISKLLSEWKYLSARCRPTLIKKIVEEALKEEKS